MSEKTLFVATPVYQGALDPLYVLSLIKALGQLPAYLKFLPGDSLVSRARNNLAAEFLKSDKTHLLFIDSDILFTAQDITTIMAHDLPIVGGLYPKKTKETKWVVNSLPGVTDPDPETGLIEVRHAGTGFLLIAREVFIKMREAFREEIEYDCNHADNGTTEVKWDFFRVGVVNRQHLSEDWHFCHDWRRLGGKVYVDTHVRLRHAGAAIYPLEVME